MLAVQALTKADIRTIVVSTGPGSYTGIRVGLATVLGLRAALGTNCFGLTSLEALSLLGPRGEPVTAIVPMGRNLLCMQSFGFQRAESGPRILSESELIDSGPSTNILVAHGDIFPRLSNLADHGFRLVNAGTNIASYLCSASDSEFATTDLSPLFVERNSV